VTLKALVFDFDGLILDTETSEFETVRAVYAEFGVTLTLDDWLHTIGTVAPHWLDELERLAGPLDDRDAVREKRRTEHHGRLILEPVLPGVEGLIEEALERGLKLGVASSSEVSWVGGHLERLGLRERFAYLSCRTDAIPPKPDPDVYRHACEALGARPDEAVALEDSVPGVRAAKAAGLWCVAVPSAMTRGMDFDRADLVVESLAGVSVDDLLALGSTR
jgi:HAD superfamily hydrolase (TIGR01509 family)